MKTLEFHRPSRDWIQVRCPCGCWTKEPVGAWKKRSERHRIEYGCSAGVVHEMGSSEVARLRALIEHPGLD